MRAPERAGCVTRGRRRGENGFRFRNGLGVDLKKAYSEQGLMETDWRLGGCRK